VAANWCTGCTAACRCRFNVSDVLVAVVAVVVVVVVVAALVAVVVITFRPMI